jgi:lipoprotein-anchoring transpeptidase ErfK/SrfK
MSLTPGLPLAGAPHPTHWLSGCEPGYNRLGSCDTMRRYIYLHGTPDSTPLGQPGSKGCVRMRNSDLIELFDLVSVGTEVCVLA